MFVTRFPRPPGPTLPLQAAGVSTSDAASKPTATAAA